jgi:hypothetical protein
VHASHLVRAALARSQSQRRARGPALSNSSPVGDRVGNEAAWWKDAGIDPRKAARKLWKQTRIDEGQTAARAEGGTCRCRPDRHIGQYCRGQPNAGLTRAAMLTTIEASNLASLDVLHQLPRLPY